MSSANCGMKLEAGDGDNVEVKVANTVIDEWEKLTFDYERGHRIHL